MSKPLIFGGPDDIGQTRSLKKAIDEAAAAGKCLNIVFVHGIRARESGEAKPLVEHIAAYLDIPAPTSHKIFLDIGLWPKGASMAGSSSNNPRTPIWRTADEWALSRPFVERTDLVWADGKVRIYEVNYWPLLFPLKSRFLLVPEHDLSGNDIRDLELVKAWLDPGELERLERTRPASGGGTIANSFLKQQIMNWGISDAVIALGPMRHYLHETVEQALGLALSDGDESDEYVVAALSLGSFVVMDAYSAGRPRVQTVLKRTADLYFFANQFALLELARIRGITPDQGDPTGDGLLSHCETASPMEALQQWGDVPAMVTSPGRPKQIIAFSDPSDLLTFLVPKLTSVAVVNVYVRNASDLFGLLENPVTAHTGHLSNPAVWDLLLQTN